MTSALETALMQIEQQAAERKAMEARMSNKAGPRPSEVSLLDKATWLWRRDSSMDSARNAKHFSKGERLREAVSFHVSRARRAHRIAMGFEPLIPNLYIHAVGVEALGPIHLREGI